MDRACKARILTVTDLMVAHARACERIKDSIKTDINLASAVVGVEILTQELLALLTESEASE